VAARITVHIVPRARATAIAGRHGDAVKIRLVSPPVEGAANDELVRFLAGRLGISRSAVTVVAGHTTRRKIVAIEGMESASVLTSLLAP
jgi:uncharacterized protein (TIGR00251 family)